MRTFPDHGRDRSGKVDGTPRATPPDPSARRARDSGRSRMRIYRGILPAGAGGPDPESGRRALSLLVAVAGIVCALLPTRRGHTRGFADSRTTPRLRERLGSL